MFINELHYRNDRLTRQVELAGPANRSLDGWSLWVYTGINQSASVAEVTLSGDLPDQDVTGFGTLSFLVDLSVETTGLALQSGTGAVMQFISYLGTINGWGLTDGMTSEDIGKSEPFTLNPRTFRSLQLSGTGNRYENFAWADPYENTFGRLNHGQTFVPYDPPAPPTPPPPPSSPLPATPPPSPRAPPASPPLGVQPSPSAV
jgi:hypothetical protein